MADMIQTSKSLTKMPFKTLSEEELKEIELNRSKALKFVPENHSLVSYEMYEGEIRSIVYEDEIGYAYILLTPLGKKLKSIERLSRSGLQDIAKRYTFDSYEVTEPYQKRIKTSALSFTNDYEKKWFSILGITGSGKSHICTAISTALIEKGCDVEYMLWVDELNRIRYNQSELLDSFMYRMKNVEVLYIDDFLKPGKGMDNLSDFELKIAFQILSARERMRKTTIISSELSYDSMEKVIAATLGRMKEMGSGKYFLQIAYDKKRNYRLKD